MLLTSDVVDAEAFAEQTGWAIKPQGACQGDVCVPLPPGSRDDQDRVVVRVVAERLGMPIVTDEARGLAALGPATAVNGRALTTAQAPELELPDFDGTTFRLSSLRGTRVLLVAWASWCGCAHDLPLWAELREQLHPRGLEIVTVAMDSAGPDAGREFVDRAAPRHPALVDVAHVMGERFGVSNVPSGIWIDEAGRIVRPPEAAFPGRVVIFEELAKADLASTQDGAAPDLARTREILKSGQAELTPDQVKALELTRIIASVAEPEFYLQMVLDWAEKGSRSEYVLSPEEVVSRSAPRSPEAATAAAHFELGQAFQSSGDHPAAVEHWREAHRLQPLNWTYKRQAWRYEYGADGDLTRYEGNIAKDLAEVGPENFYAPLRP
ncbi:MAG: hypothetical protein JWL64_572 [Frankiales bacterium]|nr:hypothetical protein [Frankiales bacterium]